MNPNLFSAQVKVSTFAASTSVPTPKQLQNVGNTLRVVNEGPNGAFFAIGDTAGAAVATLPADSSVTSCYVAGNADITFSIPADTIKFVSAICRTGSAVLEFYVGDGL